MGKINEFKSLSAIALDNGHFLFGTYCKQKLKVTQPLGRTTLVLLKSGDFANVETLRKYIIFVSFDATVSHVRKSYVELLSTLFFF